MMFGFSPESDGQGVGRFGQARQDVHRVYELVSANQAVLPVRSLCRVLKVSPSGYYE